MFLYLDTSEKKFEIRLYNTGGSLVDKYISKNIQNHSDELVFAIDELLKENNLDTLRLKGLIVITGPGSYTGLRVGVATANAIAYARNIPIISFRSDEALPKSAFKFDSEIFTKPARVYYLNDPHITTKRVD